MSRRRLVVGNWKMNLDERAAGELAADVAAASRDARNVELALAPPFPFLRTVLDRVAGSSIAIGAQDVHWEDRGAFTGAVSSPMLAGMGVQFTIVGHSERRRLFGDDDAAVARKTIATLRHGLVPIVCIGETESERNAGQTLAVIERQLRNGLAEVTEDAAPRLTLAYEPVWAIGTGRVPTADQVTEVHGCARERIAEMFGAAAAQAIRILYGGSVGPANAGDLLSLDDVDGALVGGASLVAEQFLHIATAGPSE